MKDSQYLTESTLLSQSNRRQSLTLSQICEEHLINKRRSSQLLDQIDLMKQDNKNNKENAYTLDDLQKKHDTLYSTL
ncbi:hypothetical protein pb186bvf_014623 [Paramecium bursaria]